jgi:16S rRNA (guanine527-N7)-methyltransferase
MQPVSRETLAAVVRDHDLPDDAGERLWRLLQALSAEPDPHTTVSDPVRAIDVHIRDSLCALRLAAVREAGAIVDIGAGAGFPGLPLAIALPDAEVDLLEAAGRKCTVIARLAVATGARNARPIHARAEHWAAREGAARYDVATARAVAPLAVLLEYAAPLLRLGGTFVAWKGAVDSGEEAGAIAAAAELALEPLEPIAVTPYAGARDLNLYLYSKVGETPSRFPRRAGVAAKRPLGASNRRRPPLT